MSSAALAAGIAGTASLINSYIQERRNFKNQIKIMEESNKINRSNWDRENLYNSPVAQMARLRAAGLNPNLVYQNGAVNASGSIESPQLGSNVADYSGVADTAVSGYQTALQDQQVQNQTSQTTAYIDYLEKLAEKTAGESNGIFYDNIMKAQRSDYADRFVKNELKNMEYNGLLMDAQRKVADEQSNLLVQQTGIAEQDRATYGLRFGMLMREFEDKHMLSQVQYNEVNRRIDKVVQDISEARYRQQLIYAQTKNEKQYLKNQKAEFEALCTQNIRAQIAMELESITAEWSKGKSYDRSSRNRLESQLQLCLDQLERDYNLSPLNSVGGLFRDIGIGVGGFMQLKGAFQKHNRIGY